MILAFYFLSAINALDRNLVRKVVQRYNHAWPRRIHTGSTTSIKLNAEDTLPGNPLKLPNLVSIVSPCATSFFQQKPSGKEVPWMDVLQEISSKIAWESKNDKYDRSAGELDLKVLTDEEFFKAYQDNIAGSSPVDIVLLVGLDESLQDADLVNSIQRFIARATVVCVHDCSPSYLKYQKFGQYIPPYNTASDAHLGAETSSCCGSSMSSGAQLRSDSNDSNSAAQQNQHDTTEEFHTELDDLPPQTVTAFQNWLEKITKAPRYKHRQLYQVTNDMWGRRSKDDILFMVLVLVDAFTQFPVKSVKAVTSSDVTTFAQVSYLFKCTSC